MSIIREDPPNYSAGVRSSGKHTEIAEKLKADPGNWYKVFEGQKSHELANRIKRGHIKAFAPLGTFEATSRKIAVGSYTIYARYVGGNTND